MRRTLAIQLEIGTTESARDVARTLERIALELRAAGRLEHRDAPVRDAKGATVGRWTLDAGQCSLFAAAE